MSFVDLAQFEPEGHVVVDGHMRVKRVGLEHHGDVAVLGGNFIHHPVADQHASVGHFLQPSQAPQGGRLAAARGAHQNQEFLIFDIQVQVVQSHKIAKLLRHILVGYACHVFLLPE